MSYLFVKQHAFIHLFCLCLRKEKTGDSFGNGLSAFQCDKFYISRAVCPHNRADRYWVCEREIERATREQSLMMKQIGCAWDKLKNYDMIYKEWYVVSLAQSYCIVFIIYSFFFFLESLAEWIQTKSTHFIDTAVCCLCDRSSYHIADRREKFERPFCVRASWSATTVSAT